MTIKHWCHVTHFRDELRFLLLLLGNFIFLKVTAKSAVFTTTDNKHFLAVSQGSDTGPQALASFNPPETGGVLYRLCRLGN